MLPNPPSIPSHNNVFGYEENEKGELVRQKNTEKTYTGTHEDRVGPGNYEIDNRVNTKGQTKWIQPSEIPDKVVAIQREKKGNDPGPGHYLNPTQGGMPLYKHNRSSVFASGVSRDSRSATQKYRKAIQKEKQTKQRVMTTGGTHARNGHYPHTHGVPATNRGIEDIIESDSDSDEAPGPGAYFKPTQNSSFLPEGKPERLQFFGSTVERFVDNTQKMKAGAEIGPGHYDSNKNGKPGFGVTGKPV